MYDVTDGVKYVGLVETETFDTLSAKATEIPDSASPLT